MDVVIDTGFSGLMSLPIATVAAFSLPATTQENLQLADGTVVYVNVHTAVVIWDGQARIVDVHALGFFKMIGMRMLAGPDLAIRVRDGGAISIALIP